MKFIEFPEMHIKIEGMEKVRIPKMFKIKQIYDSRKIEDIPGWIKKQMETNLSNKEQSDCKVHN